MFLFAEEPSKRYLSLTPCSFDFLETWFLCAFVYFPVSGHIFGHGGYCICDTKNFQCHSMTCLLLCALFVSRGNLGREKGEARSEFARVESHVSNVFRIVEKSEGYCFCPHLRLIRRMTYLGTCRSFLCSIIIILNLQSSHAKIGHMSLASYLLGHGCIVCCFVIEYCTETCPNESHHKCSC